MSLHFVVDINAKKQRTQDGPLWNADVYCIIDIFTNIIRNKTELQMVRTPKKKHIIFSNLDITLGNTGQVRHKMHTTYHRQYKECMRYNLSFITIIRMFIGLSFQMSTGFSAIQSITPNYLISSISQFPIGLCNYFTQPRNKREMFQ